MDWLMEDTIQPDAGLSLARMTLDPGAISEAHRHPNCSETIHLLSGRIEQRRGEEWLTLEAGDTVFVPAGALHQTRNIGEDPADMIIAYSNGSRIYEAAS